MSAQLLVDACLVITFGSVSRLGLITGLRSHGLVIGGRSLAEVVKPPASEAIREAVRSGQVRVVRLDPSDPADQAALCRLGGLPQFRNRGDGEALALAERHRMVIGSDDIGLRRCAVREFGGSRVAGTIDILKWAVAEGRISRRDAVSLLPALDSGPKWIDLLKRQGRRPSDVV